MEVYMKALKITIFNVFLLCLVILGLKFAFRIYNIGFQNMMLFWVSLIVVFGIVNHTVNNALLGRKRTS
jgi:hypothetical protein